MAFHGGWGDAGKYLLWKRGCLSLDPQHHEKSWVADVIPAPHNKDRWAPGILQTTSLVETASSRCSERPCLSN